MPDDRLPSAATPTLGHDATDGAPAAVSRDRRRPPGWGADLAPRDRPAVPMERQPARLAGVHWSTPEQQPRSVEVLCSLERPGVTPVFGSTLPPRGLSGRLRGYAFRFSENDLRHWLLLLVADRIDVGEGLLRDLASGRVPNLPAEMGMRAELRHNPRGAARKIGLAVGVLALVYLATRKPRKH